MSGEVDEEAEEASDVTAPAAETGSAPAREGSELAFGVALGVTALTATCMWFAFDPTRAGSTMLSIIGGTYAVLLVPTLLWLAKDGSLKRQLIPARGDISVGALLAMLMYVAVTLMHRAVSSPGDFANPWILRLYLQIGDPRVTATFYIGLAIMAVAAAEEIIWRGWVMRLLIRARGEQTGWLLTTALYAAAHLPTVWLLRDEIAGLNPLLVLAATGCGLVWGFLAARVDRLAPSVFAHVLFAWAVVEFPVMKW